MMPLVMKRKLTKNISNMIKTDSLNHIQVCNYVNFPKYCVLVSVSSLFTLIWDVNFCCVHKTVVKWIGAFYFQPCIINQLMRHTLLDRSFQTLGRTALKYSNVISHYILKNKDNFFIQGQQEVIAVPKTLRNLSKSFGN